MMGKPSGVMVEAMELLASNDGAATCMDGFRRVTLDALVRHGWATQVDVNGVTCYAATRNTLDYVREHSVTEAAQVTVTRNATVHALPGPVSPRPVVGPRPLGKGSKVKKSRGLSKPKRVRR